MVRSDEVEERPTSVCTLQEIATVNVAIALWNRATIPSMEIDYDIWQDLFVIDEVEVSEWIEALPVPKLLVNSIKECVERLNNNVIEWARHFKAIFGIEFDFSETLIEMFSDLHPEAPRVSNSYLHVDRIMWYPNGRINLMETARNLLKSDDLTNARKFHLASAYCLQEEIANIWPMLEINNFWLSMRDEVELSWSPLSVYWANFCESKYRSNEDHLLNELIIYRRRAVNWAAIEYIFDRLNTEQQVEAAVRLIYEFGLRFQKLVLMKLNESQRVSVIAKNIICIIQNYSKSEENEEDAIATWYEFQNFITRDQFANLLSTLLSSGTKDAILTEIWNTGCDVYKRHVLNYDNYHFIETVLDLLIDDNDYKCNNESGLTFVSSVLSYCGCVDIKREITKEPFFIECCLRLCCCNSKLLDRLLNLFLLDAAASTEYKKSLPRSPHFNVCCKTLITDGRFQMLVKLLDFGFSITAPSSTQFLCEMLSENMKLLDDWCLQFYSTGNLKLLNAILAPLRSSYPEIITEYKKNLLLSGEGLRMCVNHFVSKDCILPRIIADGVPADLAAEFKRKIISSPEAVDKLKSMMVDKRSNTAMKLIDWYMESKRARNKIKKLLEMAYLREMKRRFHR